MPDLEFPFPLILQNHFGFQFLIPEEGSMKALYQQHKMDFPYWSRIWPSSIAISQWILEEPELINGLNVMEIGAGIGLPSFVSSWYAQRVIATDHQEQAVSLINRNIQINKIENINVSQMDWRHQSMISSDIYLLSDVNYDPQLFDSLKKLIDSIMISGLKVLLSTPQRISAAAFIDSIHSYIISQHVREIDETVISLYKLGK